MALNYVTVTETFNDGTGTAVTSGVITFTPSSAVYAGGVPVATPASPIVAQVVNGALKSPAGGALQLLATDNTGVTVEGLTGFWYWTVTVNIGGSTQTWSFFLPHTPTTVDLYSLANTTAGGGGFTSPMTTLGDIIYENATPAAARLAGSTTATKNFLTQTGTGSVSAAPAWGTIAPGDLPVVTFTYGSSGAVPSSGTYTAGSLAIDQNDIVRVCTVAGSPGTWQRVYASPWQFFVEDYGAKGDGKMFADGVTSSNTTFTSATAGFVSGDTSKRIVIHGGNGTTSGPVLGSITFVNATTVTLSGAAGASVSSLPFVYGTDDATAITNCVNAASAYAIAANFDAEVVFGSKLYVLAALTQTGNGSSTPTFNSHIPIPYPNANGTTRKLVIRFTGAGDGGFNSYWESSVPSPAGTCLVSTVTSPQTTDPTFGLQSIIGGPTAAAGFTGGFANVKTVIKGIATWQPIYTNTVGFDQYYISQTRVTQCAAHAFAPTGNNGGALPYLTNIGGIAGASTHSIGFRFPNGGNNDDVTADDLAVEGFETAYQVNDHFNAGKLIAIYNDVCLKWDASTGPGTQHGIFIQSFSAEQYNGGFTTNGGQATIDITWDCEGNTPTYDINAGSGLTGWFKFTSIGGGSARSPVVSNGAANLKIVNNNLGVGHMASPPSVPATTVSAALVYKEGWVTVHTGAGVTVSAITIDGTATGLTMAASSSLAVLVPSGKTIALTYAGGTPTWDWWIF